MVELRFPMGFAVDTKKLVNKPCVLRAQNGDEDALYQNVTNAQYGEDLDAFLKTLVEMRTFSVVMLSSTDSAPTQCSAWCGRSCGREDDLIIEVTSVYGELAQGMIVEGAPTQSGTDQIVLQGYRYLGGDEPGEWSGDVEIENERYRLAYAVDESLRL